MSLNDKEIFEKDLDSLEVALLAALQTVDAATEFIEGDECWPGSTRVKLEAIEQHLEQARFHSGEVRITLHELQNTLKRVREQRDVLLKAATAKESDLVGDLPQDEAELVVWLIAVLLGEPVAGKKRDYQVSQIVRGLRYIRSQLEQTEP